MRKKRIRKIIFTLFAFGLISGYIGFEIWKEKSRPPILEIYIFNKESGRSMLIRTPDDKRIIIDGGSNKDVVRQISKIIPFFSRRIEAVVATNDESKNVSGLVDIVERYKVEEAYVPKYTLENIGIASSTDLVYKTFLLALNKNGVRSKKVVEGERIILGQDLSINFLFPAEITSFKYSKSSAPEILFNLSFGKNNFLFLGNASNKTQKYIASSSSAFGKIDVLIVSHSALPSRITKQLVDKFHPSDLVFSQRITKDTSVDDNFDESSSNVATGTSSKKKVVNYLNYLNQENKFNTKEGTVKITSDGYSFDIEQSSE